MTAIDYPSGVLPAPLIKGAKYRESKRLLRTKMDSGYNVVRKRFTKVPVNFSLQLILDPASLSFLEAWYAGDLDYGTAWFNMDLPVGNGLQTTHECRFLSGISPVWKGRHCTVNLSIEAVELSLGINYDSVMEGLIASLGGVRGFEDASAYMDKFDVAINQTYPTSGYGQGT